MGTIYDGSDSDNELLNEDSYIQSEIKQYFRMYYLENKTLFDNEWLIKKVSKQKSIMNINNKHMKNENLQQPKKILIIERRYSVQIR